MRGIKTYERHETETERHEGAGTGLDLIVEDVLAEALAVVTPHEPYDELHGRWGTGLELDADEVMADVEDILKAGEMIESVDAYLESHWMGAADTGNEVEAGIKS